MNKKYVICSRCGHEMNYHYDDTIPVKPVCEECQHQLRKEKK